MPRIIYDSFFERMLAILGFATVGLLLAVIMSRRMSPLVALIAVPTVAAVLAGMGGQIGRFVLSGLQQTAPVAAMFVFAILYFGVMTDAGLLDPVVDHILRVVTITVAAASARRCRAPAPYR